MSSWRLYKAISFLHIDLKAETSLSAVEIKYKLSSFTSFFINMFNFYSSFNPKSSVYLVVCTFFKYYKGSRLLTECFLLLQHFQFCGCYFLHQIHNYV